MKKEKNIKIENASPMIDSSSFPIEIIIITGLSGAGKTTALRCLEDMGYYCIDNLPPLLLNQFISLCKGTSEPIRRIALGIDIRGKGFFNNFLSAINSLKKYNENFKIIFLDAQNEILVRRFSETRRRHPLSMHPQLLDDIKEERKILKDIKAQASIVIDTSLLKVSDLKQELVKLLGKSFHVMQISIITFGFKHGIPLDIDLLFDVRFLPNPHYVDELRPFTGLNNKIKKYILNFKTTKLFLKHFHKFISFLLPCFMEEKKVHLTIGIGCTGGRHRSVTVGEWLKNKLLENGYIVNIKHRDI